MTFKMKAFITNPGLFFIGKKIFALLDNASHLSSRLVCKSWSEFLDYEFFDWPNILLRISSQKSELLPNEWSELVQKISRDGSLKEVKLLVPIIANYHPENTPLHQAAYAGDLDTVLFLLPHFQDQNLVDSEGNGLLHVASLRGHLELVRYISMCQSDKPNNKSELALHSACIGGSLAIYKILTSNLKEEEINPESEDGTTPLHNAARCGHKLIVKYICAKIKAHPVDKEGMTPLHLAAQHGHEKICEYLLKMDKKLAYIQNTKGEYPVHLATQNGHYEVMKLLLHSNNQRCEKFVNGKKETLIHIAAKTGQDAMFRYLLPLFEDKNPGDEYRLTPLHLSSQAGHFEITEMLLDYLMDSSPKDIRNRTPLHYACMHGHLEIVKLFIPIYSVHYELNPPDEYGLTPIKYASMTGHFEVIHTIAKFLPEDQYEKILDLV